MNIKWFNFPTFDEWNKNERKADHILGAYRCTIDVFCWDEKTKTYMFAVSLANKIPSNIYTTKLFVRSYEFSGDMEELKQWYENTIAEFKIFWMDYIRKTYTTEDK